MIAFDTSALVAILNGEPEAELFARIISDDGEPVVSALTLYETMLVIGSKRGPGGIDDLEELLTTNGFTIATFDYATAHAALAAYRTCGVRAITPLRSTLQTASRMHWPTNVKSHFYSRATTSLARTSLLRYRLPVERHLRRRHKA